MKKTQSFIHFCPQTFDSETTRKRVLSSFPHSFISDSVQADKDGIKYE